MGNQFGAVLFFLRPDPDLAEERLVVAALGCLGSFAVDGRHILGQLQRHSQRGGIKLEPFFGSRQGLLSSRDFVVQSQPLVAEGIRGNVVALFGMKPQQAALLALELGDQLSLGCFDLSDGLLADGGQGFDGGCPLSHFLSRELYRALEVVALNGIFNESRWHVPPLRTGGAVDAPATEKVGVLVASPTGADAVDQPLAAIAAKDASLQIVQVLLGSFAGRALFVQQDLHLVEGVLIHQRCVATPKDLLIGCTALVDDPPGVVRITQDALEG